MKNNYMVTNMKYFGKMMLHESLKLDMWNSYDDKLQTLILLVLVVLKPVMPDCLKP
jgi:hypothetical protein